jgi:hypothetical protein
MKEVEDTGSKQCYTGTVTTKNGVGIVIDKNLRIEWWTSSGMEI